MASSVQPTGHLQIKGRQSGRRWYALWRDADGRHQRLLGVAHVKDSGRRTPRGAIIWRVGDGPKPSNDWLTPREASEALQVLLRDAPRAPSDPPPAAERVPFDAACREWLRYIEFDRQRESSTLGDYRNTVNSMLLPAFGADTPVGEITTEAIDAYRERLLAEGRLSRRTIQKSLVLLHGILRRAQRRRWIASNPAADAERVSVQSSGDFNVLTPDQVAAVARMAGGGRAGVVITVAAFTGLRLGELRALRWQDVDFNRCILHVRRAVSRNKVKRPKSHTVRSVPMIDQVATALGSLRTRENFARADDFVFCNAAGDPLSESAMRRPFYRGLEKVGLGHLRRKEEPIVFHDLRHTFGTLAVQAFPLSDVMAYMGHSHVQTTMIYVHHVPRHDAAARLAAAVSQGDDRPSASSV